VTPHSTLAGLAGQDLRDGHDGNDEDHRIPHFILTILFILSKQEKKKVGQV